MESKEFSRFDTYSESKIPTDDREWPDLLIRYNQARPFRKLNPRFSIFAILPSEKDKVF